MTERTRAAEKNVAPAWEHSTGTLATPTRPRLYVPAGPTIGVRLDALPLSDRLLAHFREQGVDELYPPQAAAVEAGVAEGERLLAAVPTASGKTLIAQLAMLTADGPALYVVPLRALATEKYETFAELPGVSVGLSTGDLDATEADLAEEDIVVATSEKVDSAIRAGAAWVERLACVVVDEIHLLDAEERGPTLEMTLAKLRLLSPDLQVVGLSATVRNAAELADWLDAELVTSDWRPVDLRTGIHARGEIHFADGEVRPLPADPDATTALVEDAVAEGGGCLVFVRSRRAAQQLAERLAEEGYAFPDEVVEEIRTTATTETGLALARTVAGGVAFHHAGLRTAHRSAVEAAFRDREVAVVCATPTLAAGVNTPARRVIVRDHERYTGDSVDPLPTLEVHQMFGRAGRPGLDPHGEAVLVAEEGEVPDLRERYLDAGPEAVTSKLADPRALETHVLATVASGFADSRADLVRVFDSTLYAHQGGERLHERTAAAVESLAEEGLLAAEDGLAATDLGALVSRVYVDPRTGTGVVDAIERAAAMARVTRLTVLEIVCDTADMNRAYVRDDEAGRLSEFAMRNADRFAKPIAEFEGEFSDWLGALKTARLLAAVADGEETGDVAERFGVGPGDVRRYAERARWLLGATESLAAQVDREGVDDVRERIREAREALGDREF
jgi:helicase